MHQSHVVFRTLTLKRRIVTLRQKLKRRGDWLVRPDALHQTVAPFCKVLPIQICTMGKHLMSERKWKVGR